MKNRKVELLHLEKKFRLQKEKQLNKEIEDLHNLVRIREETVNTERTKEKEVVKKNLTENEQKIENQREKIRELTNMVQELTKKSKHQESTIYMLEMTAKERETVHKGEVEHFEANVRQLSQQCQEQQEYIHNLKNENNTMKIQINQLKQTVEGQKSAYENLRNQLANVYKERQDAEKRPFTSTAYIPKVKVDMADRGNSFNRSSDKLMTNSLAEPKVEEKAPMSSRWAKPVSEITRPAGGFSNSTSTPRPDQFAYKNSLTRNNNKETSMMEKYCSNSIGQILNWGGPADEPERPSRLTR